MNAKQEQKIQKELQIRLEDLWYNAEDYNRASVVEQSKRILDVIKDILQ